MTQPFKKFSSVILKNNIMGHSSFIVGLLVMELICFSFQNINNDEANLVTCNFSNLIEITEC